LGEIANVATANFRAPMTRRRHTSGCDNTRSWVNCGCPTIQEEGIDYCHSRFYGQKAIQAARDWQGIVRQQLETNRGGYPTLRAKGAKDLVRFVERLGKQADDARQCLSTIINNCVLPWLAAEEGITQDDLAENGKVEDFSVLLGLCKSEMTIEQFLTKVDELSNGCAGDDESESVLLGTIHWSKGAERERVVVNTTRLPIVPPQRKQGQLPTGKPPTMQEERRLLFVGITRAKSECVLIGSREWNGQQCETSKFVEEMGL